jgi:hypothetical protein
VLEIEVYVSTGWCLGLLVTFLPYCNFVSLKPDDAKNINSFQAHEKRMNRWSSTERKVPNLEFACSCVQPRDYFYTFASTCDG